MANAKSLNQEKESCLCDVGNEQLLRTIDGALFVLALDDQLQKDEVAMSKSFLHGDGTNRSIISDFTLCFSLNF